MRDREIDRSTNVNFREIERDIEVLSSLCCVALYTQNEIDNQILREKKARKGKCTDVDYKIF